MQLQNFIHQACSVPYGYNQFGDTTIIKATALTQDEMSKFQRGQEFKIGNSANEKYNALSPVLKNSTSVSQFGSKIDITTYTAVLQDVVQQQFYNLNGKQISDYIPVRVGYGAYADTIVVRRQSIMGDIDTGLLDSGTGGRIDQVEIGMDSITLNVHRWAKQATYNIIDLQQASQSGNWDIVRQYELAKKTQWEQMLIKTFALGNDRVNGSYGLLNQSGVTTDTTTIAKPIKDMTAAEINALVQNIMAVYLNSTNYAGNSANTFVIPHADYAGLAGFTNSDFPLAGSSKLDVLQKALVVASGRDDFKVLPLAYGQKSKNGGSTNIYALYDHNPMSMEMHIPLNYTSAAVGTINNFQFNSVSYGAFTGVALYRPQSLVYFTNTASI